MAQLGVIMQENGTAHCQTFVRSNTQRYAAIVKKLNLQIKENVVIPGRREAPSPESSFKFRIRI
jgi:hypothetical protein